MNADDFLNVGWYYVGSFNTTNAKNYPHPYDTGDYQLLCINNNLGYQVIMLFSPRLGNAGRMSFYIGRFWGGTFQGWGILNGSCGDTNAVSIDPANIPYYTGGDLRINIANGICFLCAFNLSINQPNNNTTIQISGAPEPAEDAFYNGILQNIDTVPIGSIFYYRPDGGARLRFPNNTPVWGCFAYPVVGWF